MPKPEVDADGVAAAALEQFDKNGDGLLDKTEIAVCPPLAAAVAAYDADGNAQLSSQEIADRIARLYSSGSAVTPVDCTVTLNGRPLVGATVRLRPAAMLGGAIQAAEGVTDTTGVARPAIVAGAASEVLQGSAAVHPGLYHVEITHPDRQLPSRYNTETELGFEVDPTSRDGSSARFDLKP